MFYKPNTNNLLIGNHPSIITLQDMARKAATCTLPILITGDTGTGKELLARQIHAHSQCKTFVVADCGILSPEIALSELFGHARGAFTGAITHKSGLVEDANQGTLFLDEIGELPKNLQVYLLRLLQEHTYRRVGENQMRKSNVRIIAATHRDLSLGDHFREDLYHRLNVLHLHMPTLPERKSDIPLLIDHFLRAFEQQGLLPRTLAPEALDLLINYSWPGNVRELEHVLARLLVFAPEEQIQAPDLPLEIQQATNKNAEDIYALPFKEARKQSLDQFTKTYLHFALLRTGGNVTKAAQISGIGRQYFQLRMAECGMRAKSYKIFRHTQSIVDRDMCKIPEDHPIYAQAS